MLERFNDRAVQTLNFAQNEARRLQQDHIDTEDLLLGLMLVGGPATSVLKNLNISIDEVRLYIEKNSGTGESSPKGHIPYTHSSREALRLALREALVLGTRWIGTEHILLGLIGEGKGLASVSLTTAGADYSVVRAAVVDTLSSRSE